MRFTVALNRRNTAIIAFYIVSKQGYFIDSTWSSLLSQRMRFVSRLFNSISNILGRSPFSLSVISIFGAYEDKNENNLKIGQRVAPYYKILERAFISGRAMKVNI